MRADAPTKPSARTKRNPPRIRASGVSSTPEQISDHGVSLQLLGEFRVVVGSESCSRLPKKAAALLAYLALTKSGTFTREGLASLLWGNSDREGAQRSLRQCLTTIRAIFGTKGEQILTAERDTVSIRRGAVEVDATQFEILLESTTIENLKKANSLYAGELLAGFRIDSEIFMEWLGQERCRFSYMRSNGLYRLAKELVAKGDLQSAILVAKSFLHSDPLREDGHRLLMVLLASSGQRNAAIGQYRQCEELLERELGVKPELYTSRLAAEIRLGSSISAAEFVSHAVPPKTNLPVVTNAPSDRTSIAVLPFQNLSGDESQDYFADGLAEDLTIALGRLTWLFVVASNSSAVAKGSSADINAVGTLLGVRYLIRGSVRKGGNRVRIAVQLFDTSTQRHLWADRFEGDLSDLFAIQDKVVMQVVGLVTPTIHSAETTRALSKPTNSLTAYDLYLRAMPLFRKSFAENKEGLALLSRAIELDPSYGAAYAFAARCYQFQKLFGWVSASDPGLKEGIRLARLAAELGKTDSEALWMAGLALVQLAGEMQYGLALIQKSLCLNPNSAPAWIASSLVHGYLGEAERALKDFAQAQLLNPLDSSQHVNRIAASRAYFALGNYEEAANQADQVLNEMPTYVPALRTKIAACGLLGKVDEARTYIERLRTLNPDVSIRTIIESMQIHMSHNPEALGRFVRGLQLAGVSEEPSGS